MWAAGHRSCASIARAKKELLTQYGADIRPLIAFCRLRSGTNSYIVGIHQRLRYRELHLQFNNASICAEDMCTRSELLESTLPAPVMSTSPSGVYQSEVARPKHPESVQAFDVAPVIKEYLDSLPATPQRFKPIDDENLTVHRSTSCMQLAQRKCVSCYVNLT